MIIHFIKILTKNLHYDRFNHKKEFIIKMNGLKYKN